MLVKPMGVLRKPEAVPRGDALITLVKVPHQMHAPASMFFAPVGQCISVRISVTIGRLFQLAFSSPSAVCRCFVVVVVAVIDDCDDLKKYKQCRAFFPQRRRIICAARPFSSSAAVKELRNFSD